MVLKSLINQILGAWSRSAPVDAASAADAQLALREDQSARIGRVSLEIAGHPVRGLTPARLYDILEGAEQGMLVEQHELFADMEEKDAQILSDLGKRKQLASEREWQIVAPDGADAAETKAAEFCAEAFGALDVEDLLTDLGDAIGHGWVHLELQWEQDAGRWRVLQPMWRPHTWFQLGKDAAGNIDQQALVLRSDGNLNGEPLWPLGWVQHRHKSKSGYVARSGLLRTLAWPFLFENYSLGDLAELLEIYGLPHIVGKYPSNATDPEKSTLLRAVMTIGRKARGIIPTGMEIDYNAMAAAHADPFDAMIRWCQHAKSRAILGGILTSGTGDGTNTNALGEIHHADQQAIVRADSRQYASTIRRDLLYPMAALNFGITDPRRAPRFVLDVSEEEDYQLLAEALPVFVDLGARIPRWWLHERTKIPEATDEEAAKGEVLSRAAAAPATPATDEPPPPGQTAALRASVPALSGGGAVASVEEQALEELLASLPAELLQAQTERLLAPVLARVQAGADLTVIAEDLAGLFPELDDGGIEDLAGRLIFIADILGEATTV